ncbi:MAG: phosphotransferase [Candidatus Berkiellales bacterium]
MLKEYLEFYFKDKELRHIFKDVVGSDDPNTVQPWIDKVINQYQETPVEKILFIESSIGVVFGFSLSNGQKIVLKIYSEKIPLTYLEQMNHIQNIFYKEDFPAPKVLSPIFPFGKTLAGFYQLIDGNKEDPHNSLIRKQLAKYLAKFSDIVDKHQLPPMENFLQQASRKKLWPTPHNVLFNLKKTSRGAGWIANKARNAQKILHSFPLKKKLAHTDWGVKNTIFRDKQPVGIFDWDSLGAMSEAEMVGRAAAQFTADWESEFKITPSPEEGRDFVAEYEIYRQKKFTSNEYKVVSAAADHLITIIARFEHAGGGVNHPYQDLLRECGERGFLFA